MPRCPKKGHYGPDKYPYMLQRESNWTASTHPSHDKAVFQQSSSLAVDLTRNRPAMSQHCSGETPLDLSGHKQTYPSSSASFAPPDRMRTDLYQKNVAFQPRAVQNEWQQSRRDVWEERDRARQTPPTSETWAPKSLQPDRMQSELNWREHAAQVTGISQGEQSQGWQRRNRQTASASTTYAPPDRMRTDLYQKDVDFQPRVVQKEWQQSRRDNWEERDRARQTPSTSETWAPPDRMQSELNWREHTAQATGISQGEQSQGWQGRNRQTASASATCAPPDRMRTDLYQKNVAFQPRAVQNEWQQSRRDNWEERDRARQTPSTSETWAPKSLQPDRMQSELNWREHAAQVTGISQGEQSQGWQGRNRQTASASTTYAPPDRMCTDLYQKNVAFQPRAVQNEWQQSRRDVWEERDRARQTPPTSETWAPPDRMQSELNWREHAAQATGISQGEQSQGWQGRNRQTASASATCASPDRMCTDLYEKNLAFQPRVAQNGQQSPCEVLEERDRDSKTPSTSETWAPPDKAQSELYWKKRAVQTTGITQGEQSQVWQGRNRQTPSASTTCAPLEGPKSVHSEPMSSRVETASDRAGSVLREQRSSQDETACDTADSVHRELKSSRVETASDTAALGHNEWKSRRFKTAIDRDQSAPRERMSSQAETASDASNSDDSPSCVPSEPLIISEDQGSLDIERNGSFDDNDDDTDFEDAPKVAFTMGNSKNCGAVYLPNKNKPDDIDEGKLSTSGKTTNTKRAPPNRPAAVSKKPVRAKKAAPAPPSKKAVVPAKKGKASESEVDSLREKANAYYASKVPAIPEGSGPRISQRKKTSRSKVVIDEDSSDESDDEDISMRCSRQLVNAYQRANTSEDADDELRCLKRAKVLLPNGFKQLPPLFSRHGEELSKLFNQESADDCTDNKDNAETNDDNNSPGQGNPEDPCPVCLEKVHRKRYQCEECLVFMCWFCLAEWLKVATTCPHCRDEKDIIIVPSDLDSSDEE